MSERLYSFKSFKASQVIGLLNGEGHTLRVIANATGLSVRTLNDWKADRHAPISRIYTDKLVEYAVRHLTSKELDSVEIYP